MIFHLYLNQFSNETVEFGLLDGFRKKYQYDLPFENHQIVMLDGYDQISGGCELNIHKTN